MTTIYSTATVWLMNAITFKRGGPADVLGVYVYYNVDPNTVPEYADFTEVEFVDDELHVLHETGMIDIASKIGPGVATHDPVVPPGHFQLIPGTYQRWCAILTADEFDIFAVDETEVL